MECPHTVMRLAATALLASTLVPTAHADTLAAKSDAVIAHAPANGTAQVILTLDGPLTPAQAAQFAALGARVIRPLPLIHAVAVRVPARRLAGLASLPFVTRLSTDGVVRKCDEYTVGSSGAGEAYQQDGLTGLGVGIAIVDSGVSPTSLDLYDGGGLLGLTYRVTRSVSFVTGDPSTYDACGHGTHVAGIAAGNGWCSSGPACTHTYYGIARRANIVSVRVLNAQGAGTVSDAIAGIQWVVANRPTDKIRVMNLSLGHPVCESYRTDPLCQAVEAAWKAGIVVVCAAGNSGRLNATNTAGAANEGWGAAYGSIQSPANDPYVITVGAMKQIDGARADDAVTTYSSRGPSVLDLVSKPDLVAAGNRIISLDAYQSYLDKLDMGVNRIPLSSYSADGDVLDTLPLSISTSLLGQGLVISTTDSPCYYRLSGTSMASPVVAGAAALLLQAGPTLSPDTVKARLMFAADKWVNGQGVGDPCTYGAGYLDIPAALQCTATVPAGRYALSPALSTDQYGNLWANMGSPLWGTSVTDQRAIWGKSALWGNSAGQLAAGDTINASRAVWGKSTVGADRAVWGKSTQVDLSDVALGGE